MSNFLLMEKRVDMTWKRIRLICGYTLFAMAVFFACLYWRFPADMFKEIVVAKFTDAYPTCSIAMKDVIPDFPPGLRIEKMELRFSSAAEAGIVLDSVTVRPDFWKLFEGKINLELLLVGYGGRAAGHLDVPGFFAAGNAVKGDLKFDNLLTQNIAYLKYLLGRQMTGKLKGSISYADKGKEASGMTGRLDFNILNGSYPLADRAMGIDKLDFTQIEGQINLLEKGVRIEFINLNGEKVRCAIKGDVVIDQADFRNSQLNITGNLELRTLNSQKVNFSITGTFMNPITKIG
jgi:type II secretion system protein N